MTLSKTRVVPDLLYYANKFIVNSVANKSKIPFPPDFPIVYLVDNKSFIRLLFDETWTGDSYRYLFREEIDKLSIPSDLLRRMMVYPCTSKYYVSDSESDENIFNLQSDDITMLDKLLQYRIDSTSATITDIVYDDLETNLSKLIYMYLDFKINLNYTTFETSTPISTEDEPLENFFESFISDTIFIYLSSLGA